MVQPEQNKNQEQNLGIYIHIPFCVKKCHYCDFLSAAGTVQEIEQYVKSLIREIETVSCSYENYRIDTIFFGGGTPSILTSNQIHSVMQALHHHFSIHEEAEITIEANPGTLDLEKLQACKEQGINRISMGLQSVEDKELKLLGRIHTFEIFLENFHHARQVGFDNINVDLMSALPDQTVESYRNTLHQVAKLQPEHISAYSLIVEEATPLEHMVEEWKNNGLHCLVSEDEERQMYYDTKEILSSYGYTRYEISNYAKTGRQSRHNLKYWTRQNYLGLGLGASSMVNNVRWKNKDNLKEYIEFWQSVKKEYHFEESVQQLHSLSKKEQMEEFMFLGLRCIQGISQDEFYTCFGKDIWEVYPEILKKWISEEMLINENGAIFFSDKGLDVSNYILSDFLLE